MQKLFRARVVATSSTRLTQTTHNTTSKKMACIASSFTGSVAALKATKIQVRIYPLSRVFRRSEAVVGKFTSSSLFIGTF